MDSQMSSLHRDWRCQLHQHFKNVGGYVNLQVAKSHPHPDIIENDWQWLCDYWSAKEQKELGERNALNRAARNNYNSSHGSKSFAAHRQGLVDPNTSQFLGDIEFHRLMYTNHQTGRWCDPQAEQDYNDMLPLRDSQPQNSDAESAGQSQQVLTEEEIVQKIRKPHPGYIKGRGRIVKGSSSSSGEQLENAEVQELKNKVATYEAQVSTYKNEVNTYQNQVSTYQNQLASCAPYIQQPTAQLNMQFLRQFNQLDQVLYFLHLRRHNTLQALRNVMIMMMMMFIIQRCRETLIRLLYFRLLT